jgi:hypothetical protein
MKNMMVEFLFYIIISASFIGCSSEKTDQTLEQIKQTYNAENVTYSKNISAGTDKEKENGIHVTIINPTVNSDSISQLQDIASNSALLIYNSLNEKERKEDNQLKITITQSGKVDLSNSYTYAMSSLKDVIYINEKTISKITTGFLNQDYTPLISYLSKSIDSNATSTIIEGLNQTDKKMGIVKKCKLVGYEIGDWNDPDGNNISIIKYTLFLRRSNLNHIIDLYFTSDTNNPKIIQMDI